MWRPLPPNTSSMPEPPRPNLLGLLAETTAIQAVGTMAVLVVPTIAPKIADALAVPAGRVGFQISLLYLAAMFGSLSAGTSVARLGPCRTGQVAMLLTAAGCMLAAAGNLATLLLGSLVIGAAYGVINPASSDLLMRHVPAGRRNLFFSIKQTGVPLGGTIIGLVGPATALYLGWSAPLWIIAATAVALACASQPHRASWDAHRDISVKLSGLSLAGFRTLAKNPALFWLASASFCFAAIQLCLLAFLVVLLVEELGFDLVTAGAILAAVQVGGALGRVLWGMLADRFGSRHRALPHMAGIPGGRGVSGARHLGGGLERRVSLRGRPAEPAARDRIDDRRRDVRDLHGGGGGPAAVLGPPCPAGELRMELCAARRLRALRRLAHPDRPGARTARRDLRMTA